MSNVSRAHDIKSFTAGDKPLTGQRLCKVGYKKTKEQPNPLPSVCVSVPFVQAADIQENITKLLPYIGQLIEDTQDKIVRHLYETKGGNLSIVTDDDISVQACIAYLSAESTGNRLTGEAVQIWFDAALADNLAAYIAEKLGFLSGEADSLTAGQEQTVLKHVKVYRELMASLAGGRTMLAEKQITGIRNALALSADDSDPMIQKLTMKLDAMDKKAAEQFLMI